MIRNVVGVRPTFSCEFFPPKTADGEATLWRTIDHLAPYRPDFVSVTYGAGGSNQDVSLAITGRMVKEAKIETLAHLTCVGRSRVELQNIISEYANEGVTDFLALRGDPVTGAGTQWQTAEGGLSYAVELVEMLRDAGEYTIAVSAFPQGHPESPSLDHDAKVLADKQKAGADFAITNLFFNASDYFDMVELAGKHGCTMPIIPGIMTLTSLSQIQRFTTLSGAPFPAELATKFHALGSDESAIMDLGVEVATQLAEQLLAGGAPGIHMYTLNRSSSTRRVFDALGVAER